jgi:hypothetical protein
MRPGDIELAKNYKYANSVVIDIRIRSSMADKKHNTK